MQISVYIATSLDGFIARPNGELDWLPTPVPGGEDYGFARFNASVDTVVLGRNTFDTVLKLGGWPFDGKQVVVLTNRALELDDSISGQLRGLSGEPVDVVAALAASGASHVYLDGGLTIQRFLAAGLVNRLIVTRVPVLIGTGIPLFAALPEDIPLRHVRTEAFSDGMVQSEYAITARAS